MITPRQLFIVRSVFFITLMGYIVGVFLRYLGVDDYLALYTAWMKSEGMRPGVDFNVDSYSILIDFLVPVVYFFPENFHFIYIERGILLLLLLIVSYQGGLLAKKIFNRDVSILTFIFIFTSIPFVNRGLDIRPDIINTFGWLSLFILFFNEDSFLKKNRLILGSLILVIIFCNKFKAAIIIAPLLVMFIYRFLDSTKNDQKQYYLSFFIIVSSACFFYSIYIIFIYYTDNLDFYLKTNFSLFFNIVQSNIDVEHGRISTMLSWLLFNPTIFIPVIWGIWSTFNNRKKLSTNQQLITANIVFCGLLSIVLNPSYYVYNLLTLAPLWMMFAAKQYLEWINSEKLKDIKFFRYSAASIIFLLPFINSAPFIINKLISNSIHHQKALHEFIQSEVAEADAVFAFEGIGIFRPSTYHWRTSEFMLGKYYQGQYSIKNEMEQINPVLVIYNYRNPGWLTSEDQKFIKDNYFPVAHNVLAAGIQAQAGVVVKQKLVASGAYRLHLDDGAVCELNGQVIGVDFNERLEKNEFELKAKYGSCTLIYSFDSEAVEMLRKSNPKRIPYLFAFPLLT